MWYKAYQIVNQVFHLESIFKQPTIKLLTYHFEDQFWSYVPLTLTVCLRLWVGSRLVSQDGRLFSVNLFRIKYIQRLKNSRIA
jgi:hypothetical protein